jgi:hypothetical protein
MPDKIYGDIEVHGIVNVGSRDTTGGYSLPYNIGSNGTLLGIAPSTGPAPILQFVDPTQSPFNLATQTFATISLSGDGNTTVTQIDINKFVISSTGGSSGSGDSAAASANALVRANQYTDVTVKSSSSAASANALIRANQNTNALVSSTSASILSYTRAVSANSLAQGITISAAMSANAYAQAIANVPTGNTASASANALAQGITISAAMSANAYVQAIANVPTGNTSDSSANALAQAITISSDMSANSLAQGITISSDMSANSLAQAITISSEMSANALTQTNNNLSSYTTLALTSSLTGYLEAQLAALSGQGNGSVNTATLTAGYVTLNTDQDISGNKSFHSGITVNGSIIPSVTGIGYTLGTSALPWDHLYVSSTSIHIGSDVLSTTNSALLLNGNPISSSVSVSSNGYGTRYVQAGIFVDPGGLDGDIVYVV